jgi:hypothetical protein
MKYGYYAQRVKGFYVVGDEQMIVEETSTFCSTVNLDDTVKFYAITGVKKAFK